MKLNCEKDKKGAEARLKSSARAKIYFQAGGREDEP